MWKRLELEWKILLIACVLFAAFAWPVQRFFVSHLTATLQQSVDARLEPLLRSRLASAQGPEREALVASLERNREWQALIPLIVKEQQTAVFGFSVVLFLALALLALWTLKRLTHPLKSLAASVKKIGRGERIKIAGPSGGALGTVQAAVAALQDELDILREKTRLQGMEKAWQDIARVMAHEIKNPLTPMRLTLDRMDERLATGSPFGPDELRKFVERITAQVDTLERLVNQFRSFSKEPEASLRNIDLRESVQAIADDMAGTLRPTISGAARAYADPYLLSQALLNLFKNALEAGADALHIELAESGGQARISLRDNGPGIPADLVDRVWLPYVSFKQGGTGLGLPVVKRLIETMGGTVDLRAKTGGSDHGVTVTLSLPGEPKEIHAENG